MNVQLAAFVLMVVMPGGGYESTGYATMMACRTAQNWVEMRIPGVETTCIDTTNGGQGHDGF